MWALVQALATLTGPDEEIRVAGLDGGPGPGDGDRRLLAELAAGFDPAEHLREARAARYWLDGGPAELLEALLFRPTMNISGLSAGYAGPGGKTITLSRAEARVDIRLVGGDPEQAAAAVRRHLADHGHYVQVDLLDTTRPGRARQPLRAGHARLLPGSLGADGPALPAGPWCAPTRVRPSSACPGRRGGSATPPGPTGLMSTPPWPKLEEHIVGAAAFPCSPTRAHRASPHPGGGRQGDPLERGPHRRLRAGRPTRPRWEPHWRYLVRRGVGAGELPGMLAPYLAAAERVARPGRAGHRHGRGAGVSFWSCSASTPSRSWSRCWRRAAAPRWARSPGPPRPRGTAARR